MTASNSPAGQVSAFDGRKIDWQPFAGIENLELTLCDLDEERQILDLLVRFAPNKTVTMHNHLAQTNMLIIQGALHMYESDGTVREIRPAGRYYRGRRDDTHSEGGGADGAVVFYSLRGHGAEDVLEIMDEAKNVTATLGMADLRAAWAAQQARSVT